MYVFIFKFALWLLSEVCGYYSDKSAITSSQNKNVKSRTSFQHKQQLQKSGLSFVSELNHTKVNLNNRPKSSELTMVSSTRNLMSSVCTIGYQRGKRSKSIFGHIIGQQQLSQLQVEEDTNEEESQEKLSLKIEREYLKFSILGNEWVTFVQYSDPEVSRVYRASAIYLKYLVFFSITEKIDYDLVILVVGSACVGLIVNKLILFVFESINQYRIGQIAVNLIVIIVIGVGVFTYVKIIFNYNYDSDLRATYIYTAVFLVDFLVFQQFIGFISYLATLRILEDPSAQASFWASFSSKYFMSRISS